MERHRNEDKTKGYRDFPNYYPISVSLTNRLCVVVGGGMIALRKTENLLACQADVVVISPDVCNGLMDLIDAGKVKLRRKVFEPKDVESAFLVVAATNLRHVNHAIYETCEDKKTLVNVVDEPSECSFIVPAIFREGPLVVSISTSGTNPSAAKGLKNVLVQDIREHATQFQNKLRAFMAGEFE